MATAAPLAALLWVGWRALEQDRDLEDQAIRQRLELAADIATAALQRAVAASERRLADGLREWPEGAVTMFVQGDAVQVWPAGRAAYLPVVPPLPEVPDAPFATGETAEIRQHDLNLAASMYRKLAGSDRPEIRAGALLRLARCLCASVKPDDALLVYAQLMNEDGLTFEGMPVSLVTRQARCSLFESINKADDLRREAEALGRDLRRGRWALTCAVAQLHMQDVERWGLIASPARSEGELLAEGLCDLWPRLSQPGADGSGRESIAVGRDEQLAALWIRSGDRRSALVASMHSEPSPCYWLRKLPILDESSVARIP